MKHAPVYTAPAALVEGSDLHLPEGMRMARGWSGVAIGKGKDAVKLYWALTEQSEQMMSNVDLNRYSQARFRFSLALNYRAPIQIKVYLLQSKATLGWIDVRYGYVFQPFELKLDGEQAWSALREGIGLEAHGEANDLDGGRDGGRLWIFDRLQDDESRRFFTPQLLFAEENSDRWQLFLDRMLSLSSLQPFGWLEGCVLDGLYDLRAVAEPEKVERVLSSHFDQFIDRDGRLRYEDLYSKPVDNTFTTIEATLPIGVLSKLQPDHPAVERATEYWLSHYRNGMIADGDTVTAEGAYTIAYPMAVAATRLQREDLARLALEQLMLRRERLVKGRNLYLRNYGNGKKLTFRNWSRAYAWYMLGLTRTWLELNAYAYADLDGMEEIREAIRHVVDNALTYRLPQGLWSCFLDEPETGIETSGSAGIAAAIALGAGHGLLPESMLEIAEQCFEELANWLSPDGVLHGVSQHNAGGIGLQRSGYRVYSQMGMGLTAQLYAAIHKAKRDP